ncbi:MAG: glycosyltransferase [Candidatus Woesearchaeota archaeon]|jgi:glycosyltransferase involved in cell wall biosynthesis
MKISVVIPAYNEAVLIEQCLSSIITQRKCEIIVVCDSCTDDTKKIAKEYTKKVYNVKLKNVSAVRNYGAAQATGEILVFIDADSIMAPNLLNEIEMTIKQGYIGGVTKTYSSDHIWKADVMWKLGNFCRYFFLAGSGLIFCKAEAFPGFDETRKLAEDTHVLLALKKKGKLKYITNSYIKTSSRRLEHDGYFNTIFKQYCAFFVKNEKGY